MKLELRRDTFTEISTLGKLYLDGEYFCETLEDVDRRLELGGEKIPSRTCIPRGTYELILSWSPRFKQVMPRLLAVPQFQGVLIHPGNNSDDTDGCILVGAFRRDNLVGRSRVAYGRLLNLLEAAADRGEKISITVA